ncbi:MAG: tRNA pseudouridine(38-40) synthase TruA [Spirochaetaceae bacterium]
MTGTEERVVGVRIAYDGTDFAGYQVQPGQRTVQAEIEKGLARLFGEPIRIASAGRTDAGVHARGQFISFRLNNRTIPAERVAVALNTRLPRDVSALSSEDMGMDFHARYSALQRVYRYYLFPSAMRDPLNDRYVWRIKQTPSIAGLNRYAACIVGHHDFTIFASSRDTSGRRERSVDHAVFFPEGPAIVFEIAAKSFMWHMVRSIVGTLLSLERSGAPASELRSMIAAGDRSLAGETAPARGLVFHRVIYDPADMLAPGRVPSVAGTAARVQE